MSRSNKKLSIESREQIASLLDHPGFKAALDLLEVCAEDQILRLIQLDMDVAEERQLLVQKARHEGARKLVHAFRDELKKLKTRQDA